MKKLFVALSLILALNCGVFAAAVDDLPDFVAGTDYIKGDLEKLVGFINSELSKQIIFNATSASVMPSPSVNLGGFEFGMSFGASLANFNKDGLYSLEFDYFSLPIEEGDLPRLIPLPAAAFHIKSGLPEIAGMAADAGIKFLALDLGFKPEGGSLRIQNYIFGLEARMQLLSEKKNKPFSLLAGLSLDFVSGRVNFKKPQTISDQADVNATLYDFEIDGNMLFMADWKASSMGIKAVISKEFFFFNPYAGFGINLNMGRASTTAGITGDISMVNSSNSMDTALSKVEILGRYSQDVNPVDFRLLAGFELGIAAFKIAFGYEYGGELYSLNGGLRFQF